MSSAARPSADSGVSVSYPQLVVLGAPAERPVGPVARPLHRCPNRRQRRDDLSGGEEHVTRPQIHDGVDPAAALARERQHASEPSQGFDPVGHLEEFW
jgi:hypothetical protein